VEPPLDLPLTMPFAMAAMPTQVSQGLCSMPAQVRAPSRRSDAAGGA